METNEIRLKDWQVPLARHQTEVLKKGRCMLSACHTGCLSEGTPVRMFDGSVKPVEYIVPGDVIESFDEVSRSIVPNVVSDNIRTCLKPKPMIQYTYENETVKTTYDHYFLVDGGYVPLYQLAWGAMETGQRVQLKLLCERYGAPLDLDSSWWKTSGDNEARERREWIPADRDGREDREGPSRRCGKLAGESIRVAMRKSLGFGSVKQLGHEPGVVHGEVQCVVWCPSWIHSRVEASATGPGFGRDQKESDRRGQEVHLTWKDGQERNISPEQGGCDSRGRIQEALPKVSVAGEGETKDTAELARRKNLSFRVLEAEPYYTVRLREAPYSYCIGREHRFPVHNSGKTYLACQTIKDLGMKTLVVCPKIAITQWKNVIAGMGASDLVVGVINPEHLVASRNDPFYDNDSGWKTDAKLLVFDEVHRGASGADSKTTMALARWCNKAHPENKALLMSATPFETPEKMRAIGYLMGFHRFVKASFYDWMRTKNCGFVDIGWGARKRRIFRFTTDRKKAEETMRLIRHEMGERFMSITPEEIPGFPEETREVVLVDLAKQDHDALVRAYAEMPPQMKHMSQDDMVKTLRLRQQAEWCKASVLAEMAADYVEDGYSVFIAISFSDCRRRIEDELAKKGVKYASIYGGQRDSERQAGIDSFQRNETHVMVGMMQACSVALSLHDERHERPRVSLISPSYSASDVMQALGRIRRVGGTTATQKIVLAAESVEERVARAVQRKIDCIETLSDRDLCR